MLRRMASLVVGCQRQTENVLVHMALSVRAAAMPVNMLGRMAAGRQLVRWKVECPLAVGWQRLEMLGQDDS